MRVLLVNPSWGKRVDRRRHNRCWPPLDLLYIAAGLREEGFEVSLCDARASGASPMEVSSQAQSADIVVMSTSPLDRWQCPNLDMEPLLRFTTLIPPEKLILCGVHGTLFPESVLNLTGAGVVVRGEPEETIPAVCRAMASKQDSYTRLNSISFAQNGKTVHNPPASPVDIASLPLPAYDLTQPGLYEYEPLGRRMAVLETSRGCPHSCTYCLKTMYGSGVRRKPLDRVGKEMESIHESGYRFVYFMDLELCLNRQRVLDLCRITRRFPLVWCCQTRVDHVDPELLEAMAGSGCRLIHYGIEAGGSDTRDAVRKGISRSQIEDAIRWTKSAGIATAGFFLLGFPWETPADWTATEKLARKLNLTYASFHSVTPYPGTELGTTLSCDSPWWEHAYRSHVPAGRLVRIYMRYYFRLSYIAEFLRHGPRRIGVFRLFLDYLKGFFVDI